MPGYDRRLVRFVSASAPTELPMWRAHCKTMVLVFLLVSVAMNASLTAAQTASPLISQYHALRAQLDASPLQRPMVLQSSTTPAGQQGDVFAVVNHPVETIQTAFGRPEHWCEAMLLHLNNRQCTVFGGGSGGQAIRLSVVRKYDQPVEKAFQLTFDFRLVQAARQAFKVELASPEGPLGTSNYRIVFEAVALDAGRSFVHFSYSYEENLFAHTAMQAYLATFGHSKVGFTVLGRNADGSPVYIRGTQGLVERNAMRYFLALDVYLGVPVDRASRCDSWYTATERYPAQLHEIDRALYLNLKSADARR